MLALVNYVRKFYICYARFMENLTQANPDPVINSVPEVTAPPIPIVPQTTPSSTVPQALPPTPTKSSHMWLRIILFIILGLIILGGAIFIGIQIGKNLTPNIQPIVAQPTSSSTQTEVNPTIQPTVKPLTNLTIDWKTYTNLDAGYSIKYPAEYSPSEDGKSYLSLMSPLNLDREKGHELQNGELKIEIVTEIAKDDNSTLKCWNDHDSGDGKILNQSEISVGGINTTIIDWQGYGTGQFICVAHGNQRYLINKYPLKTTRQEEFFNILSTFNFVK